MTKLLDQITDPEMLKALHVSYLPTLADEIREELINTVSTTGGHLSSNLGTVELTIALHYVFDSPVDKIIWDVGHQAYTHKILTGRRAQFTTLRQFKGLSGFVRRGESPHDIVSAGHAGTALSTALGIARGRDHEGEMFYVVAVVGDGCLPNGMNMEALNNIISTKTRLTIILNDNDWSISRPPGSLASCLATARSQILRSDFFKEFGLKYLGPVDGHNIKLLVEILEEIKDFESPVVLHVVTQKGKGYAPAMSNPCRFHGTGPFDVKTGKAFKKEGPPTYTRVFAETLCELAEEDQKIIVITAGMPDGTGVSRFASRFPDRFYDVGIAEEHAVTFAGGLAASGQKPVVAIYSTFLQRAYDQIIHDVCLQDLPVTFVLDRAGLVGEDGPTHHGVFDYAYLRHIPNMVIMTPKDENELRHMLKTAIEYPGPSALRYPKGSGSGVSLDEEIKALPVGKGEILSEGNDVAIIAIGSMVYPSMEVAKRLETSGISVRVVNARFVKPLDTELILDTVQQCKYVVTVEDHVKMGGFGSAVLECLVEHGIYNGEVMIIGLPDKFIEHGDCKLLKDQYGLSVRQIEKLIKERWFPYMESPEKAQVDYGYIKIGRGESSDREAQDSIPKRRLYSRIPFNKPIRITFNDLGTFMTQYSSNISENGMFIRTESPFPVGTRFQFEFTLRDYYKIISGEAEVIWIKKTPDQDKVEGGMGVRFIDIDHESKELIRWFTEYRMLKLILQEDSEEGSEGEYSPFFLLDPYELKNEMERIAQLELPETILPYAEKFSRVSKRNPFLWKWCLQGAILTTLPSIDRNYFKSVLDTKLLGFMFAVLADDISDEKKDPVLLNEVYKIPLHQKEIDFSGLDKSRQDYLKTVLEIWNAIMRRVHQYPRYKEFVDTLLFDYLQYLNALRYSYVVNLNPYLINMAEHNLYQHHNMHIIVSSTMDLMCSPDFDKNELGLLREIVLKAQQMGRIGNMITTWEREIKDRDFSSGIYPYLVKQGIVTYHELQHGDLDLIREKVKASGCEKYFLRQWEIYHHQLCDLSKRIRSADMTKFVEGFEKLIHLHLGSVGLK